MTKGTPSMGLHNRAATHTMCRRCGKHSYFKRKHYCASCGYGHNPRLRTYAWSMKYRAMNGFAARNGRKEAFKRAFVGKHTKRH